MIDGILSAILDESDRCDGVIRKNKPPSVGENRFLYRIDFELRGKTTELPDLLSKFSQTKGNSRSKYTREIRFLVLFCDENVIAEVGCKREVRGNFPKPGRGRLQNRLQIHVLTQLNVAFRLQFLDTRGRFLAPPSDGSGCWIIAGSSKGSSTLGTGTSPEE